jgi:hypothetical protein
MSGLLEQLDEHLANAFSGWNGYSTLLATAVVAFVTYTIVTAQEPDIHPMILQRQSMPSPVRKSGESAIYRSPDVPHGYPLRTGLSVKSPVDPPYTAGRDGDLRDVWKRVTGEIPIPAVRGQPASTERPRILTVLGSKEILDHNIDDLTNEISVIGAHIQKQGGKRVAVYLPNSVELLSTIFGKTGRGLYLLEDSH